MTYDTLLKIAARVSQLAGNQWHPIVGGSSYYKAYLFKINRGVRPSIWIVREHNTDGTIARFKRICTY